MAVFSNLRRHLTAAGASFPLARLFSTASPSVILNPSDPSSPLSVKQKSRAALSLLKSEKDPAKILSICRAAALSPEFHLDRSALSLAAGRLTSSPSSLRSLISDLLLSPRVDVNPTRARPHAIVLFGQANLFDDALSTFTNADKPSVGDLNAILFAAILSNKHSEIPRLFRDLPTSHKITPNLETYNTVIKSFCESGSARSVNSLIDEMQRARIKPNLTTYNTWIAGLYKEEKFDDVPKVFELMKKNQCYPALTTWNTQIQSLCKIKRAGDAKALFHEMVSKKQKPNWVTYNHLIFGFCSIGDLEEAKKLYKQMKSKGCVPDSKCYFTLIFYLCKGGDFEAALEVCKDSVARNWYPCFSTMKMLVNGLVNSSRVEEANEIVEKVKNKFSSNTEMWKEVEEALAQ